MKIILSGGGGPLNAVFEFPDGEFVKGVSITHRPRRGQSIVTQRTLPCIVIAAEGTEPILLKHNAILEAFCLAPKEHEVPGNLIPQR
jgi:hypothetical protein